jgi:hypothetical protein
VVIEEGEIKFSVQSNKNPLCPKIQKRKESYVGVYNCTLTYSEETAFSLGYAISDSISNALKLWNAQTYRYNYTPPEWTYGSYINVFADLKNPIELARVIDFKPKFVITAASNHVVIPKLHRHGIRMVAELPLGGVDIDSPVVDEHPEWVVLTRDGNILRYYDESKATMDPRTGWRDVVLAKGYEIMKMGMDGLWIDDISWNIPNYNLRQTFTIGYMQGQLQLLRDLTTIVKSFGTDKAILVQGTPLNLLLLSVVDGGMWESYIGSFRGFVKTPNYMTRNEFDDKNISVALQSSGKSFFGLA